MDTKVEMDDLDPDDKYKDFRYITERKFLKMEWVDWIIKWVFVVSTTLILFIVIHVQRQEINRLHDNTLVLAKLVFNSSDYVGIDTTNTDTRMELNIAMVIGYTTVSWFLVSVLIRQCCPRRFGLPGHEERKMRRLITPH